ncbi:MAG TPA: glycosyltransferase [Thermoanaerobaculia bacterium]
MRAAAAAPEAAPRGIDGVVQAWVRRGGRVEPLASLESAPLSEGLTVAVCTLSRPEPMRRSLASIAAQTRPPDQIVIVDASADDATERVVREAAEGGSLAMPIAYVRVAKSRAGLTRQRNVALALADRRLIAFFDDDVTLREECLAALRAAHDAGAPRPVGVGALVEGRAANGPTAIWRVRRLLRMVPHLEPGRYCRSGMSTPWSFVRQSSGTIPGDWLPGYAMMWDTALARELRFDEGFAGYAQSEDLEFSLRAGRRGPILLACAARVVDAHAPAGRPNDFKMGYMAIYNRFLVHRRGVPGRSAKDVALFAYAWTLDTLLLMRHLVHPTRWPMALRQAAGRARAAVDLLRDSWAPKQR